jgi:hypothetical protein
MYSSAKAVGFLLLDAALLVCLFSMPLCMRPMRVDFVSEWMRQCKANEHWYAYGLPVLLAVLCVLIVLLQLDWMHRVSLHHLQQVAKLDHSSFSASAPQLRGAGVRTRMCIQTLACREQHDIVSVQGHSDAAFVAKFAAIVGIAAVLRWDWTSPHSWWHFYGVLLFCAGFFVLLQIVWLNLHTVSTVARLRHMPPMPGMHWLIDSAIILFLLLFLMLNFILGQTGPLVVASELLGFALLMLQFIYVFQACCQSGEPPAVHRRAAWTARLLVCFLLLLPFFVDTRSGRHLVN